MSGCPSCEAEISDAAGKFCSHCGHDLRQPSRRSDFDGLIGQTVDGRYRVVERIGMGGMGIVYRVEHVRMGKIAAMKVLRRDLVDDGQAIRRFRREVQAVSRLDHPHIVQTFDYGEWHGLSYLVMEYIRGEDLGAIIKRTGRIPVARALPLFAQICAALEDAHEEGIIHRDLKPDNIVCLQRRNQAEMVKVLDFGLAKLRERSSLAEVTGAGSLIGTPYYMAPEQVRGETVDERTDIYALGATMYRVLTGVPLFQGPSPMAILGKHLSEDPIPPSTRCPDAGLGAAVDDLMLKALAKDRANRFANAADLRRDIEATLAVDAPAPSRAVAGGTGQGGVAMPSTLPSWIDNPVTAAPADVGEDGVPGPGDGSASDEGVGRAARLRRADVDAFERMLRRRKVFTMLLVPLLLLFFGGAGVVLWRRSQPQAGSMEREPNNNTATANPVPNGTPVYGHIGSPHSDGTPDMDYFHVALAQKRLALTAQVTAIPNLDLVLELFDGSGKLLSRIDGGKNAKGEFLGPFQVGPLDAFVRVRAVWVDGKPVRTSETPYALTVTWGLPDPFMELEPNDDHESANTLAQAGLWRGHLSTALDRDVFVLHGPVGSPVTLVLDGKGGDPVGEDCGLDLVLTADGRAFDQERAGGVEKAKVTIGDSGTLVIAVSENPRKRQAGPPRSARQRPYGLLVSFSE